MTDKRPCPCSPGPLSSWQRDLVLSVVQTAFHYVSVELPDDSFRADYSLLIA
jgi:hypothetical protein